MFTLRPNKKSSREQIAIKGVRDGILSLPGKKYRAVLEVSPVNFALKSEEEQEVVIDNYQRFLNSLSMPIQIIMRARAVDMDQYTASWREKAKNEKNPIYKKQIEDYTEFVDKLVTDNSILTRKFYVVVPDTVAKKQDASTDADLVRQRILLNCDIVAKGLNRLGMQTRMLESLEVLDLFYTFYNPKRAKVQPLTNLAQNSMAEGQA